MANWPNASINDGYTIVNGSLSGSASSKVSCWLEYRVVSQSITNNTSTIRFYVYLATSGNTSQLDVYCNNISSSSRGAMSVSIGGSTVYTRSGRGFAISRIPYRGDYVSQYSVAYNASSGQKYLTILTDNASSQSAAYGECTIAHNSDGTRQVAISLSADCSYSTSIGTVSGSVSVTLPTIPRSTTPSVSAITLGSAATITLAPASAAFTHTLRAVFGSRSSTTIVTQTAATSISWTPSLDEAYSAPNAASAVGTLYCDTYSGSTLIGTAQISITAAIPVSIVPSGSISDSESVSGLAAQFGCYVQYRSKLAVSIASAGAYGSTISTISASANGATYSGSSFTTAELATAGTNTINVTITDSRGRTVTISKNYTVVAYSIPSVSSLSAFRCNSAGTASNTGTYVSVAIAGAIAAVNSRNTKALRIGYKLKSATTYTDTTLSLAAYSFSSTYIIGGSLSNQAAYDIRVTLVDYFGETYAYTDISTADVIMSVRSTGMGLAIGKVSEENKFEVGWASRFHEDVQFDGSVQFSSTAWLLDIVYPIGSIRMTTSTTGATTFMGGTWVLWGSGRVPVGVNTGDSNFNTVEKTGGASTVALSVANLPSHAHSVSGSVSIGAEASHTHRASSGAYKVGSGSGSSYYYMTNNGSTNGQTTGAGSSHSHSASFSGSGGYVGSGSAHSNLQPYITCYFYKRTA